MLKLTLSPITLQRDLAAAKKSLESLLEEAELLRIYSYPTLDALVASAVLFHHSSRLGVRAALKVAPEPPKLVESESFLIGYRELNYKTEEVRSKLVALSSGELKSIPVHGATYVEGEGSSSAMLGLMLEDLDPELLLLTFAGSYASKYVGRTGKFSGLDQVLLERLKSNPSLALSMKTVLKVYKPHERDACTAMKLTLDPYYPGITGTGEGCRELPSFGAGEGLRGELIRLEGKLLQELAVAVLEFTANKFKLDLNPEDIVGGLLISENRALPFTDPREASHALLYVAEASRDLGRVAATVADLPYEYPMAEARLEDYAVRLAELVKGGVTKGKINLRLKVYEAPLSKGDSPTLLWRALRTMRAVEQDSIIAFRGEDGLFASPLQLEEALGYGAARRVGEWRDGLVWLGRGA
ncbi:MAG: hypothetical protein NZ902_03845 [Acidilobaceae archaeon]|nr:hypothetical protein [Acidilobaceae archaeon]MDW7974346.1 hypothetical protein [Sulfolobales archaeon]